MTALEQLDNFTLRNLPDLDTVVLGALELFCESAVPPLPTQRGRTLVLGSGNAAVAGRIVFAGTDTRFAGVATYQEAIKDETYDQVVVLSASGGKHAVPMVQAAQAEELPVIVITNNQSAPAAAQLDQANVLVFPKNREPYTYNTSTYLGPILAATGESAATIHRHITNTVEQQLLRNLADYSAFCFILPDDYREICDMINTKFDELFGPAVVGRAFTVSEIMHAKTVVCSGDELFIALGVPNQHYGLAKNRLAVTLPPSVNWGGVMATAYYVVGKIQAAHPPYFKSSVEAYCKTASAIFNQAIKPIVE